MRAAYVDTSCMAAIAFGEPEAQDTVRLLESFDRLISSNLLEAELTSALTRHGIDASPSRLLASLDWLYPDRPLTPELRRATALGYLRGADLWHVACALYVSPEPDQLSFLTLDKRQEAVAAALGFRVA